MKITFLGTGTSQGVPVIGCKCDICGSKDPKDARLRTSVMVAIAGKRFVIDTGPDFRQQMLREDVSDIDWVLYTHEHKDHVAGMDDLRAFNFIQKHDMDLYVSESVEFALRREFHYAFAENKYPGVPSVKLHRIENKPFVVQGVDIIPIRAMHHKLPVFGFRIGDFTYITDANYIDESEKQKIKGSKILVLNALRRKAHISHFTLNEAITLAQELEVEQTYFTHLSHQMGTHKDVEAELPMGFNLAYDTLQVSL